MNQTDAERLVALLIKQLAEGTASWILAWKPGERFMPFSPASAKTYRGIHALSLLAEAESCGYRDLRWMTGPQAEALGARARDGERPTILHLRRWRETVLRDLQTGKQLKDEQGQAAARMVPAELFNAEQIEGLPPIEDRPALPEMERHAIAEAMLAESGVPVDRLRGASACYCVRRDRIILPERAQFSTADSEDAEALHQLAHATGHARRLVHDIAHPVGSLGYAREELRTNIASLMLGEQLGIGHDPAHHLSYVDHWINILSEDPWEIFRAAADAETIVAAMMRGASKVQAQEPQASGQHPVDARNPPHKDPPAKRLYIDVPYAERDQVKALGAKWDAGRRSWYVPQTISREVFGR